jgi:hypothetical protein
VRVAIALAGCACVALLLVGCGAEDDTQRFAREAVETHVAATAAYDDHVRCTSNPRPWLVEEQATSVICAVRKAGGGGCDWFRVDLVRDSFRVRAKVRLDQADAGCVLPP